MRTIALHGDFAHGSLLAEDCGIDSWSYPSWWQCYKYNNRDIFRVAELLAFQIGKQERVNLVGYSRGGKLAAIVSRLVPVNKVVLYECAPIYAPVPGEFPVLWIENNRGRRSIERFADAMAMSLCNVEAGHSVSLLHGQGRHTRWSFSWPMLRHGWDQSLNGRILEWLKK